MLHLPLHFNFALKMEESFLYYPYLVSILFSPTILLSHDMPALLWLLHSLNTCQIKWDGVAKKYTREVMKANVKMQSQSCRRHSACGTASHADRHPSGAMPFEKRNFGM